MLWLQRLRRRARALFRRADVDREMADELRSHLELETEHLMRTRGLTRKEARRQAHVAFGGVTRYEEAGRDARGVRALEDFIRDLGQALHTLRRTRGFAAVAVLTFALGIGALTAVFAIVNSIILQPLPYPDADRLVSVQHAAPGIGLPETGLSTGTYFHYRAHGMTIEALAIYQESALNLAGDEGAERIRIANAGPDLFRVLRTQPVLGRLYAEADWTGSAMNLNWTIPILLSYDFWQRRFGGDPSILGRVLTINDSPREVFGVMPKGFAFPRQETQVWQMLIPRETGANFASTLDYGAVGRLRAGATAANATAEYQRILPSIEGVYADATPARIAEMQLTPVIVPLKTAVIGETGTALWILFGGMTFLLLVACANVANLFVVRSESRAREIAVRTALGASRAALARLFVAESLALSLAGAVAGLVLAGWVVHSLVAFTPVALPRLDEVRLDGWTLAFAAGITVLAGLVFGLLSLMRHTRALPLSPALKSGGGSSVGRGRRRLLDTLVAVQIAFALALLVGSALMVQSYIRLTSVDPGYNADGVLTVDIGVPSRKAATQHRELYDAVADRMRRIPGVLSVGGASVLPLAGGGEEQRLRAAEPDARTAGAEPPVGFTFFVPGYFQTMQTRHVDGIGFAPGERTELAYPVVVSEALARRLFPGERAVGKRVLRLERDGEPVTMWDPTKGAPVQVPPYTIAGVVRDMRDASLHARGGEMIYLPVIEPRVEQSIVPTHMAFVLRTGLPPLQLAAAARTAVYDVDPTLSIARIRTMDDIVAASTATERFLAVLLLIASVASLLLGAVGIYGIGAYAVRRRTPEIGVRAALGAEPRRIVEMILRESFVVILIGIIAGLAAATAGSRALRSLLFDVSPIDPVTIAAMTLLLIIVALTASLVPARRAARIDPVRALRSE